MVEPEERHGFTFADAPAIVRAHQKDSYFESVVRSKIQEVLQIFRGQRFVNTNPGEITVLSKAIYLCLTTLLGSKTLGEEYTDLIYVNRDGKRLPRLVQRLGFIVSYAILPYIMSKALSRWAKSGENEESDGQTGQDVGPFKKWVSTVTYNSIIDTVLNLHIAFFYLHGKFYQISKRVFGLRYVFGHKVDRSPDNGSYEVLGFLILVQFISKAINKFKDLSNEGEDELSHDHAELLKSGNFTNVVYGAKNLEGDTADLDLANPKILPYIPEASRKCILCLEYMKAPSAAPCGHMFCWRCIIDWSRERPECALCRQAFEQQQIITLR